MFLLALFPPISHLSSLLPFSHMGETLNRCELWVFRAWNSAASCPVCINWYRFPLFLVRWNVRVSYLLAHTSQGQYSCNPVRTLDGLYVYLVV